MLEKQQEIEALNKKIQELQEEYARIQGALIIFGKRAKLEKLDADIEEERRMFYVAMTRAKSRLHIFFLKERYGRPMVMSRFVGEILVDRDAVKPGMRVQHQTYGAGVIKEVTDKAIVIRFDKIRQEKKLDIQFCLANQLLKIQS